MSFITIHVISAEKLKQMDKRGKTDGFCEVAVMGNLPRPEDAEEGAPPPKPIELLVKTQKQIFPNQSNPKFDFKASFALSSAKFKQAESLFFEIRVFDQDRKQNQFIGLAKNKMTSKKTVKPSRHALCDKDGNADEGLGYVTYSVTYPKKPPEKFDVTALEKMWLDLNPDQKSNMVSSPELIDMLMRAGMTKEQAQLHVDDFFGVAKLEKNRVRFDHFVKEYIRMHAFLALKCNKNCFAQLDQDGEGKLHVQEVLLPLNYELGATKAKELVKKLESDVDGCITLAELEAWYAVQEEETEELCDKIEKFKLKNNYKKKEVPSAEVEVIDQKPKDKPKSRPGTGKRAPSRRK